MQCGQRASDACLLLGYGVNYIAQGKTLFRNGTIIDAHFHTFSFILHYIYCNFKCQEAHNHIQQTRERNSPINTLVRDLCTFSPANKKAAQEKGQSWTTPQKKTNKPIFFVHCISCSLLLLFLSISPSSQSPAWFQHTFGMGLSIRHYQKTTTT